MKNANQDIMKNQEEVFIHLNLKDDDAYKYSVKNNDSRNMQITLRAYGEKFDEISAIKQIEIAKQFDAA